MRRVARALSQELPFPELRQRESGDELSELPCWVVEHGGKPPAVSISVEERRSHNPVLTCAGHGHACGLLLPVQNHLLPQRPQLHRASALWQSTTSRPSRPPQIRRAPTSFASACRVGPVAQACHFGLDICISIGAFMPCLLGENDETRPIWLANPTPSRSPRVSALITVYLGDT
jgi:hypothetical protein